MGSGARGWASWGPVPPASRPSCPGLPDLRGPVLPLISGAPLPQLGASSDEAGPRDVDSVPVAVIGAVTRVRTSRGPGPLPGLTTSILCYVSSEASGGGLPGPQVGLAGRGDRS